MFVWKDKPWVSYNPVTMLTMKLIICYSSCRYVQSMPACRQSRGFPRTRECGNFAGVCLLGKRGKTQRYEYITIWPRGISNLNIQPPQVPRLAVNTIDYTDVAQTDSAHIQCVVLRIMSCCSSTLSCVCSFEEYINIFLWR